MVAKLQLTLAAAALLALLAIASGQPCIECKDCKTNNCYSVCQKSCPKAQPTVDGNKCKKFGADKGWQIGKDACGTTQKLCSGGKSGVGAKRRFPVSLTQCENIAYGACQAKAKDAASQLIPLSPCRLQVLGWGGYQQCSKQQWTEFFNGEVNELCEKAVSVIDP